MHDGSFGTGRFCCDKCARSFATKKDDKKDFKWGNCSVCGKDIKINKRASSSQAKCNECRKSEKFEFCKNCGINRVKSSGSKFCSVQCGNLYNNGKRQGYSTEDILEGKYPHYGTSKLHKKLLNEGYKDHRCEICGTDEWNGEKVPLILDHINGSNWDHRWENLQLICPNCNAQTPYNNGKNKRNPQKQEITDEQFIDVLKNSENIRQALIELKLDPNGSGNYKRARQLLNYIQ